MQDTGIYQESYNRHSNISKIWCSGRNARLNHVLTHFRQIYKTINKEINLHEAIINN